MKWTVTGSPTRSSPASSARQPVKPPTGAGPAAPRSGSARRPASRTPAASTASDSSVTALATSRPPGGSAARQASSTPSRVSAAADEDRVRARAARPAPPARGRATIRRPGTPSAAALRRDRLDPARRATRRDRPAGGMAAHPLDADAARAGADVPEQRARHRPEHGQRHRPDLTLGELAVALVRVVRQPGTTGDRGPVRRTRSPSTVERVAGRHARHDSAGAGDDPLAGPPSCSSTVTVAGAVAGVGQQRGHLGRGAGVAGQHQQPAARVERAVQRRPARRVTRLSTSVVGQRPAEPGGGQRHRRRVRQDADPVRRRAAGPGSRRCRGTSGRRWPARAPAPAAVGVEQAGQAGSSGDGQGIRSAATSGGSRSSWRGLPKITSAAPAARLAAYGRGRTSRRRRCRPP